MWRLLLFSVKVALLVAAAYWLVERPGNVAIDWLGYRVETSFGVLLLAIAVLVALAALLYRLWRALRRAPRDIGHSIEAGRRRRGYKALTQGMVAVAAGAPEEAQRWARKADSLLDEPPLTMLLSAQAAQLNGDEAAARRYFQAMLDNPETRFLGLRGLLTQALRDGDDAAALGYARQAYELRPRTPWVVTALFDLSERSGDLETAERALKDATKIKALPAPEADRRQAVLAVERARAAQAAGRRDEALKLARDAQRRVPGLVPATALRAELLLAEGQARKAATVLERAWAAAPHPELARLYLAARPSADVLERYQRLVRLTGGATDHPESHLALARAALAARLWGEARRHLKAAAGPEGLDGQPSEAVCRLMAEIAEAESGDELAARAWLERAASAPADPTWVCASCGASAAAWSPRCRACGAFDGLAWRRPPVAPMLLAGEVGEAPAAAVAQITGPGDDGGAADQAAYQAAGAGETAVPRPDAPADADEAKAAPRGTPAAAS